MFAQDAERNNLADYDEIAVSTLKESTINTFQDLGAKMLVDRGTILSLESKIETDANVLKGMEEDSELFFLGDSAAFSLSFPMMQAQHLGFGLSFALGSSTPAAYGTGVKHSIVPLVSNVMPGFTAAMRYGKTINKRRLASLYIDALTLTMARNSWAKLDLGVKGTGKFEDTTVVEAIPATAFNVTELTLDSAAVAGATAAERLANVHAVYAIDPVGGQRVYVEPTAVSGATPAVITIPAAGVAVTETTFYVTYIPAEPAWATFPAKVSEPPLRVTDLSIVIDGKYSAGDIVGGYTLDREIKQLTYKLTNAMDLDPRVGGTGDYSNYAARTGRQQFISVDMELRNWLLEKAYHGLTYMGVKMQLLGAEFETGKKYGAKGIFPRCGIVKKSISVDGKVLAQAGDLQVLEDGTNNTCYWEVYNKYVSYAQAA